MATNYILENCNSFFTDRLLVVMKFAGKDFPSRPTGILKSRSRCKLMYQNVICLCSSFYATFKSLEEIQCLMFGWLCRRNDFMVFHPTDKILQYCSYTKVKSSIDENYSTNLFVKSIFTYRTLDPFVVIIHGIVRF